MAAVHRLRRALPCSLALLCAAGAGTAAEPTAFRDPLDGFDPSRWLKSHDWANGWEKMLNGWLGQNLRFADGRMQIRFTEQEVAGRRFASGEYQSRAFYGYGRFEVRLKAAAEPGMVTGFFTYTGPTFDDPHHEIDFEFLGMSPRQVQLNYFTDGVGKHETDIDLGFDASRGFHTYAFEWRPDSIRWFVDGRLVHEETGARGPLPTTPGKIYLHLWAARDVENWIGRFDFPGHPVTAEVDCVAFRPLGSDAPGCGS